MTRSPRDELATMGAALGGARWVQGPGGNVSVKTDGGELWVKASGARLADVAAPDGHARVLLATAAAAAAGDPAAEEALFAGRPRPSLETYFHALGGRVVAHTHAAGVLLMACSRGVDNPGFARAVVEVPYVRPGRGVALALRAAGADAPGEGAFVLRSHGLVAFAADADRAVALTLRADELARAPFGRLEPVESAVERYLSHGDARAAAGGFAQPVPARPDAAAARYLFPDAAVCASVDLVPSLADPAGAAAAALARSTRARVLTTADGQRLCVAARARALRESIEVLAAHDWLQDALAARGAAAYLADDEPAAIVDMPAEQYRVALAASRGRAP